MGHRFQQAFPKNSYSINRNIFHGYDMWLLTITLFLICLGLVMVTSSSITLADRHYHDPLYYFWRQLTSVGIALGLAFVLVRIPMEIWERLSTILLVAGCILLTLVLVPGIGREVNGSMRWIHTWPFPVQASEPAKFCIITYLAGYLVRHGAGIREQFAGFIKPIIILTIISALLLLEPDYGACVVIFSAALGMLFLGGVPLSRFVSWMLVAGATLASLAILSPYRIQRLISFVDPWQDPFNSGFQLTQALIAFGRGNWLGTGLGSSIQKLFYLPEAHTDFVFAIVAEELGLWGSLLVILLFCFLVWRAFVIGQVAEAGGRAFSAYFAYGTGLVIGTQAFINIGVNMGVLPTKGLTLPFVSYGGNSMIVTTALVAVLLRIEYENRQIRRVNIPPRSDVYAK
ncbi:MAG: putative lipid II flippase FtsW [Gammaproteobacteria bacterium]